ncbi:hypothetical protein [Christiangramia aquimixticola]|uniref:hypothetical protein n=1 Tax=Christiangramia aquimixticola TaxID=1697558 RepID=UPI003AA9801B
MNHPRILIEIILSISLLLVTASNLAQTKETKVIPPGTIWVKAQQYVDNVPVTNIMYLEYLNMMSDYETSDYDDFQSFLKTEYADPDKGILIEIPLKSPEVVLEYDRYTQPGGMNKPVLISHAEAENFCAWRTKFVNHHFSVANDVQKNAMAGKIEYRLPTSAELKQFKALFKKRKNYKYFRRKEKDLNFYESRYIVLGLPEYTADFETSNLTKNREMGFRCVCEINE